MEWMWDRLPWIFKSFSCDRNMLYLNVRQLFLLWPSRGRFGTPLGTGSCGTSSAPALAWHSQAGSIPLEGLTGESLGTTETSPSPACPSASGSQLVIMQPDKNKGCSAHNCLHFRHVLYFPSPCIELANDPSQGMGLNCNCTSQNCRVHSVPISLEKESGTLSPQIPEKNLQYPKSSL